MASNLRSEVLKVFKKLHRTRLKVFQGDDGTLSRVGDKINEEFKNKRHVTDENSIRELIKQAEEVETFFRTQVIQVEKKEDGNYKMKLRKDNLLDNVSYNDDAVVGAPRPPNQRCKK